MIISVTASVTFDYDTEDGIITTAHDAVEDVREVLPSLDPTEFEFTVNDRKYW